MGEPRIKPDPDPRLSRSMEYGLAILECFAAPRLALGIADMAELVGLSRSTTHRYATTLVRLGYLEQDSSRKYRLARRAADVGAAAIGALRLKVGAEKVLEDLRERTGHTVALGVLNEHGQALYIECFRGHRDGQYVVDRHLGVGAPVPLCCTAMGKALLAALPPKQANRCVDSLELTRHGPNTIISKRKLIRELNRVRERNLAVSDEEHVDRAHAIAMPLHRESFRAEVHQESSREEVFAVEVNVPASAYTAELLVADVGPLLEQSVKLLSSG